jgi:hypothetical protein
MGYPLDWLTMLVRPRSGPVDCDHTFSPAHLALLREPSASDLSRGLWFHRYE